MPVAEAYARKFGGPERAAAIIDHVTAIAAGEGLEFHLDRARRANTRDAHRLLASPRRSGAPATRRRSRNGCWRRTSRTARTSATTTCSSVAATEVGLDGDGVRALLDSDEASPSCRPPRSTAAEAGITAVPTYVIDGRWSIPGAQDPDVFVQVLRRLATAERAG